MAANNEHGAGETSQQQRGGAGAAQVRSHGMHFLLLFKHCCLLFAPANAECDFLSVTQAMILDVKV